MAIITKILGGIYTVYSGGEMLECRARGLFRHTGETPLVGDIVEISIDVSGAGTIQKILPRRNEFLRPPVANVDAMVIVASAAVPVTEPFLIDRMAAVALSSGVQPIICINKTDIDSADELFDIYSSGALPVFRVSAVTGEGVDALVDALYGKTSVLTGNSGVGKSSILNTFGLEIEVGEVSDKLGRGRHTTRHVEIHALKNTGGPDAYIIDTPGFSSFDTGKMSLTEQADIEHGFPEFEPYLGKCRFRDCAHVKEPGCAVRDALRRGEINASRHRSYVRLLDIAKDLKAKEYK